MPEIALEGSYFAVFPLDILVYLLVLDIFIFLWKPSLVPLHSADVGMVEVHTESPWYGVFPGS
jgi:hypothetical protein